MQPSGTCISIEAHLFSKLVASPGDHYAATPHYLAHAPKKRLTNARGGMLVAATLVSRVAQQHSQQPNV